MILSAIVSISILVLSVFKMNDVLKNRQLQNQAIEFEQQTKKTLRNDKGFISLFAASFTMILSLLALLFITKLKIEYNEALYRNESYLCFHYLTKETEAYIVRMGQFNIALRSLFAASLVPATAAAAKTSLEVTNKARDAFHLYYLKNLTKNKFCQDARANYDFFLNLPFKTKNKILLEKNIDHTSILRENEWKIYLTQKANGIRKKKIFCLEGSFSVKNAFFPETQIHMAEIAKKDMSNLKCFLGSQLL